MSKLGFATVKVLFFAKVREYTEKSEVFVEIPSVISGKDLLNFISEKYNLEELKCNVIVALNENWIDLNSNIILKDADEVAIIPPLSGGLELGEEKYWENKYPSNIGNLANLSKYIKIDD